MMNDECKNSGFSSFIIHCSSFVRYWSYDSRRPDPLGRDLPVREGIRLERLLLKPMRQVATAVIDTTRMNVHELRDFIQARFRGVAGRKAVLLSVVSFGFRFGVPPDADLV